MNNQTHDGARFGRVAAILPVKDLQRATDFYIGVAGFRKVFENGSPVGFMILKRDDAELHLSLQPDYQPPAFNVAHIMVEDVDGFHALCKSHGLRIIKGLQDKDYGLRAFVFEDTEGNRIDVGARLTG